MKRELTKSEQKEDMRDGATRMGGWNETLSSRKRPLSPQDGEGTQRSKTEHVRTGICWSRFVNELNQPASGHEVLRHYLLKSTEETG
ncbi:Hypothetical protein NTJ_14284 [Nesidiocoris tenuis]|uniref:Uncharacterized protein n=1 Tax=Nesidiocoris tenuis TaxID=355587 RepID=A0ABN7BF51_9HEMI|nr:Hypothetical protein NTJ_14284 [Nesidiocoris tenuis]